MLPTTVMTNLMAVPGYFLHFFTLHIHEPVVLFLMYRKSWYVSFLCILHCVIHMGLCVDWRLTERDGWVFLWESALCQNMCTCLSVLECHMLTLTCHFFGFFIPLSMKTTAMTLYSTETTGLPLYSGIQGFLKMPFFRLIFHVILTWIKLQNGIVILHDSASN